jgi:diguanylate cyclase (GGDEF)-like protein
MQSRYLQTRVARQLFVLFLLAALVPLLLMAFFSYAEVSNQLVELNNRWLRQESKTLGMSLVQRLRLSEREFRSAAEALTSDHINASPNEYFSALKRVSLDRSLGLSTGQLRYLELGKVVLESRGTDQLSMLVRLPGKTALLQGTLIAGRLWRDEDMDIPYCVLAETGEVYYCSPEMDKLAPHLTKEVTAHSGTFTWNSRNEAYLGAYWKATLEGLYANQGFSVVMALPKQDVLRVLDRFRQVFPALMVLAFVVAVWLTLRQLRRQMKPLTELAAGAHRLADGDFDAKVTVRDEGEFGVLAGAFNLMTRRLRQKFYTLGALGELDRAILSSSEMEYIVQTVLQHAPHALSCDFAGILQLRDCANEDGLLSYRTADEHGGVVKADVRLDQSGQAILTSDRPWMEVKVGDACMNFMPPVPGKELGTVLVFRAMPEGHPLTVFIVGFKERPEQIDDLVQAGRNFADRLTIAGSNIAWEEKLYHQAHYDALTDLPNRVLLRDRVEHALSRARRDGRAGALMLIDLDRFKEVNDTLGHAAGDKLLIEFASKLAGHVRESDTVARLGGDEFIVLLTDLDLGKEGEIASGIASELQRMLVKPVSIHGEVIRVEASIGIALFPDNGDNFEVLLKAADAAMYESKREQRGGMRFYSEGLNSQVQERFHLAQELRVALEQNEFLLHYQPKVDAQTGRIVGAEALIRWNSPKRGIVPPGQFIPIVDDIGLGSRLGEWVLNTACAQLAAWDRMALPAITLSVNISPVQFHQTDIVTMVLTTLAQHGLAHDRIELEILEATAVEDSEQTRVKLKQLREHKLNIALDDFGTGYSSLVYLTRIPANVLKLDLEFIRTLSSDRRQASIVAGIISLAQGLGMQIVAEGVEEKEQWNMLKSMDCDLLQGYLFSRPVAALEFVEMLRQGVPVVAGQGIEDSEIRTARRVTK